MKTKAAERPFIVTLVGQIFVDTTVAVIAESGEDAAEKALRGSHWDPSRWLSYNSFEEDPIVADVSEEADWGELEYADQKHLLPTGYLQRRKGGPHGGPKGQSACDLS